MSTVIRATITVALTSLPGWLVAILVPAPILGWALGAAGIALGLRLSAGATRSGGSTMLSGDAGWLSLEREVARARRYGQALTLLRIEGKADGSIRPADIAARCREIDIAWEDDGIWLLAAGADLVGREPLIARLRHEIAGVDRDGVRAMTFPGDAMTVHALVAGLLSPEAPPVHLPVRPVEMLDELSFGQEAVASHVGGGSA